MVEYFDVLQSANPYRGYGEIYDKNFATVKKSLFEMHMPALEIDHKEKQYIIELRRTPHEDDKKEGGDEKDEKDEKSEDEKKDEKDKDEKNKEIIEYIQIKEHSFIPEDEKKSNGDSQSNDKKPSPNNTKIPLHDRKKPIYEITYNKHTQSFNLNKDNKALQADTQKKEARDAKKVANEQAVVDKKKVALQIKGNAEEAARIEASEKLGVQMERYKQQQATKVAANAAKKKVENNAEEQRQDNQYRQAPFRSSPSNMQMEELSNKRLPPSRSQYNAKLPQQTSSNKQLNLGPHNKNL
jgi:hypothetical protein